MSGSKEPGSPGIDDKRPSIADTKDLGNHDCKPPPALADKRENHAIGNMAALCVCFA